MSEAEEMVVRGTAYNEHAGASVGTGRPPKIFIAGLDEWPDDVHGHPVEVRGRPRAEHRGGPQVDAEGLPVHNATEAEVVLLEEATWEVLD